MIKDHKRQLQKHSKAARAAFEKAKAETPLHKRLVMMEKSYENLRFAKQTARADSLKKRLDPMVEGFYKKELGKHLARARSESAAVKGRLATERAALDVAQGKELTKLRAAKDKDVKFQKRSNERSSDEPFGLHYAAMHGEVERLDALVARPKVAANIDQRDPDSGWTALHFAARGGHVAFARRLLGHRAAVNALGPSGETPLHLAAGWGTLEMVGLLLQEGADKAMVYETPDGNKTAWDVAKQNLRTDIARFVDRWLPVGLSYASLAELSEPGDRPHSEEQDKNIQSQLRALDMKMRVAGRKATGLIFTYAKLVNLYRSHDRFEEAIASSKRIVEIRQHDLQATSTAAAAAAAAAATSEEVEGSLEGSLEGRSLEGSEDAKRKQREQQEKRKAVAEAMNNLGELCFAAGEEHHSEAKRYFPTALNMMEELFGKDHALVMPPLLNQGTFLLETRDYEGALGFLNRYLAFEIRQHTSEMGTESLALVPTLDLLAYCHVLRKDWNSAEALCDRANAIVLFHCSFEEKREQHMDMCPRHDKMGFVLFCKGDLQGAQKEYYKARDILEINGREEFDVDIARLENNIAVCCCATRPVF